MVIVRAMRTQTLKRLRLKGKGSCRECGMRFEVDDMYATTRQPGPLTPPLCIPCAEVLNVV